MFSIYSVYSLYLTNIATNCCHCTEVWQGGIWERVHCTSALLTDILLSIRKGFIGSYLHNNLKTNQLEVLSAVDGTTTSAGGGALTAQQRAIARLKEPRELFALPKGSKDGNDCAQQTARWPIECQVRVREGRNGRMQSGTQHFGATDTRA